MERLLSHSDLIHQKFHFAENKFNKFFLPQARLNHSKPGKMSANIWCVIVQAVWDGHGGVAASEYCSENVERFLDRHLEVEERRQAAAEAGKGRSAVVDFYHLSPYILFASKDNLRQTRDETYTWPVQ
jgi:hypothetical protein